MEGARYRHPVLEGIKVMKTLTLQQAEKELRQCIQTAIKKGYRLARFAFVNGDSCCLLGAVMVTKKIESGILDNGVGLSLTQKHKLALLAGFDSSLAEGILFQVHKQKRMGKWFTLGHNLAQEYCSLKFRTV